MSGPVAGASLHATCLAVGEHGLLIRGASGSGKTTLACEILRLAALERRFARLVGDDRVTIASRHGRLVARPGPAIAGLIEHRGVGLLARPFEPAVRLSLVVDCAWEEPPRLPEAAERAVTLAGVTLLRLAGRAGAPLAALILERIGGARVTGAV